MVLVKINYDLNESGERIDSLPNQYADFLAADIQRYAHCKNGHEGRTTADITLSIKDENNERVVFISSIENTCCHDFLKYLQTDLKKELKF